ncbi:MAG: S24/S26 family peptidase [Lachnospiraceae bacterium]
MNNKKDIEKLLAEGNVLRIKPDGYSMYPMFVPGRDEAVIRSKGRAGARRGDVVLYRRNNGMLVLHRMHHKGKDGVYMVGDNQVKTEGPLNERQVIGILDGFIRNGKYISADNILYKALSSIWLFMRPFRRPFQLAAAWIKKKIFKGRNGGIYEPEADKKRV